MPDSQEIDLQLDARRVFANDSRCWRLRVYAFLVPLDSRLKPGLHVWSGGHQRFEDGRMLRSDTHEVSQGGFVQRARGCGS